MIDIEMETGGSVWQVLVKPGDRLKVGDTLFILEVMKMEVPYQSPAVGEVVAIHIAEGDVVEEGQLAVEIAD